jgi:hypothetical protein
MKALCSLALLLALALRADDDCDAKTLEKGWYCRKCDSLLEKDALNKEGQHADCKTKPEECKVCVKSYFVADC